MTLLAVFAAAAATALATGLGALPFLVARRPTRRWLDVANVLASVVMVVAAGGLFLEGAERSTAGVALGAVAGAAFVEVAHRALPKHGIVARRSVLVVGVMTVHSLAEGVGIGAAFGDGETLGIGVTVAMALHNVPEGLAISLVLIPAGASVWSAAKWSVFSSVPQPALAVPAFLFVEAFESVLPAGLGFAGGAMVWLVARDLLPETVASLRRERAAE